MAELRKGAVTLKGGPVDLAGAALTVGAKAPEFSFRTMGWAKSHLAAAAARLESLQRFLRLIPPFAIWKRRGSTSRLRHSRTSKCWLSAWTFRSVKSDGAELRASTRSKP